MKSLFTTTAIALALNFSLSAGEIASHDSHDSHNHGAHSEDFLKFDLSRGWFEPQAAHDHSGEHGARYIHPLTIEAAFNDNDLFIDYAFNSFDDEEEHEIEIEFEFALTRRLGLVVGLPYVFETEDGVTENGFGDLELAGRFVLAEYENFVLTAGLGFGIPIGEDDFSADQLTLEPSLLAWFYLGNGFSLNTALGAEFETRSNESEIFLDAALIKHLGGPLSVSVESRNAVTLRGDERGDITSEATLGVIYQFNSVVAVRGGWSFPIQNDEFNSGAVFSLNYTF